MPDTIKGCVQSVLLDRDVHQLVVPGAELRDALRVNGEWSDDGLLRLVYREH